MKTRLNYTVRNTRAPGETRDAIVPVIVERLNPVELETVVENCIDRGLIAGLKTTAAHGIAEGVAAQIAREFSQGRGVQFGQYFYGRPYLSGTVDGNGRLTSENSINVRLYKGNAFKLALSDYALHFLGSGDAPKIDFIVCDGDGVRGQVVKGASVKINGRFLYSAGDTVKVCFQKGTDTAVEVTTFTATSDELLTFACPAALVAGNEYRYWVERTDANGVTRTTDKKPVNVVAAAIDPDAPVVTSGYSSGYGDAGMIDPNADFIMEGHNLAGASVKVDWTDEGGNERTQNIPAGEVEAEDESITLQQGDWLEACTTADGAVLTFTVTTSHGSTTYNATVRA